MYVEDPATQIQLDKLDDASLGHLRFFMGGYGDARHFYTSLLDLDQQASRLSSQKITHLHANFTLNDIKPQCAARLLIMLSVLRRLKEHKFDDIATDPKAARSAALCVFVYISNVMPDYIYDELTQIITKLIDSVDKIESDEYFSSFVRIKPSSAAKIKQALQLWLERLPFTTERMMANRKNVFEISDEISSCSSVQKALDEKKAAYCQNVDSMTDEHLDEIVLPNKNNEEKRAILKKMFSEMSNSELMEMSTQYSKYSDYEFAKKHGYLIPPLIVLNNTERSKLPDNFEITDKTLAKVNIFFENI